MMSNLFVWFGLPENAMTIALRRLEVLSKTVKNAKGAMEAMREVHATFGPRIRAEALTQGTDEHKLFIEAQIETVWFCAAATEETVEAYMLSHGRAAEEETPAEEKEEEQVEREEGDAPGDVRTAAEHQ